MGRGHGCRARRAPSRLSAMSLPPDDLVALADAPSEFPPSSNDIDIDALRPARRTAGVPVFEAKRDQDLCKRYEAKARLQLCAVQAYAERIAGLRERVTVNQMAL